VSDDVETVHLQGAGAATRLSPFHLSSPSLPPVSAAPPGSSVEDLPSVIGGRFRPLRFLARGGMGVVYEVVHVNTGEHLALKLMLSRARLAPLHVLRFRQEARIHSLVRSEHLVRVLDADIAPELDGTPFLVMELLTGLDFERLCASRRPSPAEVIEWLRQIGGALDKAHGLGIVHRDLKPENLFLAVRDQAPAIVKILDFGVAKLVEGLGDDGAAATTYTTMPGQILGTPRYMSPEQARGSIEISSAADRFALGLVAYRLLFGRSFYDSETWVDLLGQAARGPVDRGRAAASSVGRAFDVWFAQACAHRPEDRFASCAAQIEALAEALALDATQIGSPGSLAPPGSPRRSRVEECRFPRVRLLGAAVLALGLVAGTPRSLGLGAGDRLLEEAPPLERVSPRPSAEEVPAHLRTGVMANASPLGVRGAARSTNLDLPELPVLPDALGALGALGAPGLLAPARLPRAAPRSAAPGRPSPLEGPSVTASGKSHDPIWDER
jgi:serine/threonine-protein kinase